MPVSQHLRGVKISNYRSIVKQLDIPLNRKMTFLVGQNNAGKTAILRFLALLLNDVEVSEVDKPSQEITLALPEASVEIAFSVLEHTDLPLDKLKPNRPNSFEMNRKIGNRMMEQVPQGFIDAFENDALNETWGDFRGEEVIAWNFRVQNFHEAILTRLPKTFYVPSQRIILDSGSTTSHFAQTEFPGRQIDQSNIVETIAQLSNPHGNQSEQKELKSRYTKLCDFMRFCLEVNSVRIRVPPTNESIYVELDGKEQPISNLGSGVEQLLLIGCGSLGLRDDLVLIDEPEIHFHPRTQKRMMKYLHKNADAKFVIATHSAAIIDSVDADIVQVWQENHQCFGRTVQNNSDRYEAVMNLGHSPSELVLANFVIWVEGPSDRIYIKHWIEKLDPALVEGTDYAIIFYGGAVLARHGFEGGDEDLVKALSISRNFAVYMDSDKSSETDELKPRVERVAKEVVASNGLCWISDCREVENYIPESVIDQLKSFEFNPIKKWDRLVKSDKFDKVKLAEQACELWQDEWPHDLRKKCEELVARIKAAR